MRRILFVDDDPYTLETLKKAAQVLGHQALLASTGQEALHLAADQAPDLIFVDISLPDMNGLDIVSRICAQPASEFIPVVVLSASPAIDVAQQALSAGAQEYISKPIRLQTLMDMIHQYAPE